MLCAHKVERSCGWEDAGSRAGIGRSGGVRKMTGKRVLGIVLAGRQGKRLTPLTEDRAKAAVPFGGLYRTVGRYHAPAGDP